MNEEQKFESIPPRRPPPLPQLESIDVGNILSSLSGGGQVTHEISKIAQQSMTLAQTTAAVLQQQIIQLREDVSFWKDRANEAEKRIRNLEERNNDLRLELALAQSRTAFVPQLRAGADETPLQADVPG